MTELQPEPSRTPFAEKRAVDCMSILTKMYTTTTIDGCRLMLLVLYSCVCSTLTTGIRTSNINRDDVGMYNNVPSGLIL